MKRRFFPLALVLVLGGVFLTSCQKEELLSSKKEVLSFIFEASKNAELDHNTIGVISGTLITANVPFGTTISSLTPSIEVSPKAQLSPSETSITNFTSPVSYTVTAEDGTTKVFTTNMVVEPAPYMGTWVSNSIDFGLGLMHIEVIIDAEGNFQMEFQEMISGDLGEQSLKGRFDPLSKPNSDIFVEQTHKWSANQWVEFAGTRTIMYNFEASPKMHFYYCDCYPKSGWVFEVDLNLK